MAFTGETVTGACPYWKRSARVTGVVSEADLLFKQPPRALGGRGAARVAAARAVAGAGSDRRRVDDQPGRDGRAGLADPPALTGDPRSVLVLSDMPPLSKVPLP